MASEWVAPLAAAGGTAIVGVAGILGTWLTGKQSRDHAETISSQQLSHERLLAVEARRQERLANAYVKLLDMSERIGQWAQTVLPMIDTNPPQPEPPVPSQEEQAHTEALMKAFGSDEVKTRMTTWLGVVHEIASTVRVIQWEESNPALASQRNPRLSLEDLRGVEREARQSLADQVTIEFG